MPRYACIIKYNNYNELVSLLIVNKSIKLLHNDIDLILLKKNNIGNKYDYILTQIYDKILNNTPKNYDKILILPHNTIILKKIYKIYEDSKNKNIKNVKKYISNDINETFIYLYDKPGSLVWTMYYNMIKQNINDDKILKKYKKYEGNNIILQRVHNNNTLPSLKFIQNYLYHNKDSATFDNDISYKFNNETILILQLCKNHYKSFKNLIVNFYNDDNYDIYLYARFYYHFRTLIKYVYHILYDPSILKGIFLLFLEYCFKYVKDKKFNDIFLNFIQNYEYLHHTMFIKNIYFDTYYNNIIKYFLPLPYDILLYCPLVTYRNVNNIYKLNDFDYFDKIDKYEKIKPKSYVKIKNIDKIKNEMDITIPIKYFKPIDNSIYLIAFNDKFMYIAKNIINDKMDIIYKRKYDKINLDLYKQGASFEILHNKWEKVDENMEFNINNVIYLSIYDKITKDDMFKVFEKCNFDSKIYKNLYHYTGLDVEDKEYNTLLNYPTFFTLTPFFDLGKFFNDRKCLVYKFNNDIDEILNLTVSIVSSNPINGNNKKMINDENNAKWTYFDYMNLDRFYKNICIPKTFNINNKCITAEDKTISEFANERPYCDIANRLKYAGRRRMQEILYKTRKYDASKIWVYDYHFDKYKNMGIKITNEIYKSNYHHPLKYNSRIAVPNYDTFLLMDLGINGFYSTDYEAGFRSGGEIMLSIPENFIKLDQISNSKCNDTNAKFRKIEN